MVVLDTCALIEAVKAAPSFSAKTTRLIQAGAYILSISFAEIACKVKLGKLEMSLSTRELYHEWSQIDNIEIIDINVNSWLDSIDLVWDDNRDPADRIITSFAIKNEAAIVTTDKKIASFYDKVIW